MNLKNFSLLALVAAFAVAFAGCAQDSTDITNENPAMQEAIAKGEGVSAAAGATQSEGTNTTRSEPKGGTDGTKVALSADPSGALKYNKTQLNANAGDITIAFTNKSTTTHDVVVTGEGDKELGATKQITESSDTAELKSVKAGDYTFFCSLPGHEQAGMKGTLTVR
ncbi:MAG: cupredoxin domain-containing protein [Thermoleophilaceae bacterium]|nr:cupredoxin domain-containing protein [Thermoleophilaceae bacterium]